MSSNDRIPPHDLDAEGAVLSACLVDSRVVPDVRAILRHADCFYAVANRRVFEAICAIDDTGTPVDITLVSAWLREKEFLNAVGGTPYLAQLIDATPAVMHAEEHARIVANLARRRAVIAACAASAAEGYGDVGDVDTWCNSVEARVFQAAQSVRVEESIATMRDAVAETQSAMAAQRERGSRLAGISTGFGILDRKTGGLICGNKYTVAGRPGMGKSAFALSLALNVASQGLGVAFLSIEMPRDQVVRRAIAQLAKLDTQRVEQANLTASQWQDVATAWRDLAKLPIAIDECGSQTAASIRSSTRRCLSKLQREGHKIKKLHLVVVDYLQIMDPSEKRNRSRENEVSEFSNATRRLAKEFNCAVVDLSQLSRECEKRDDKRPRMSDLRESGSIEQDAFGIFFLYREEVYDPETTLKGTAEVLVAKLRQGGSTGKVLLGFRPESTSFFELAPTEHEFDEFDNFSENGNEY